VRAWENARESESESESKNDDFAAAGNHCCEYLYTAKGGEVSVHVCLCG